MAAPRRQPTPEGLWTCSRCLRALPREAFYRLAKHYQLSGLTSWCRECTVASLRARRARMAEELSCAAVRAMTDVRLGREARG